MAKPQRTRLPSRFTARERAVLAVMAQTIIPGGARLPAGGGETVERLERLLQLGPPAVALFARGFAQVLNGSSLARYGRTLRGLPPEQRESFLRAWTELPYPVRMAPRALYSLIKAAHLFDRQVCDAVEARYDIGAPAVVETPRYMQQVVASDGGEDVELEVNAIVVGTGAGGAVVAKELAELGYAVVMVEEGRYFTRKDFNGQAITGNMAFYRSGGLTATVGNAAILLPQGRTVGGTTTVNSGTCYRVPDRVLAKWRDQFGLSEMTPDHMAPYFERVERILQVEPAREEYWGGSDHVIRRGCERLGLKRHGPLHRNAPACDGQGVCAFGCPTDAKRGTNVTYVPLALQRGAMVYSGFKVTEVVVEHGRAVGVVGYGHRRPDGSRQTLRLRAPVVVVSCGAIQTPRLLLRNRLANGSGELGRNLSIHPAASALAEMGEEVRGWKGIPQCYTVEDFHDEGLLFEGGFVPIDILAGAVPFIGKTFVDLMERYNHLAAFGFLLQDTSRGRVVLGPGGQDVILYNLNRFDVKRLQRGLEILCRIYFAAGARRVMPGLRGHEILSTPRELRAMAAARVRASDFELSAYHPLGTARMGVDPSSSVVDADHRVHDVEGLYIVDGSSVPSSVGVNPMMTIMAMATRAAERIAQCLEAHGGVC